MPDPVTKLNRICRGPLSLLLGLSLLAASSLAQGEAARRKDKTPDAAAEFPDELVHWQPIAKNPVFTAEGPGHWDAKIRERGWILREGDEYRLWFTGYDGKREDRKLLGYATSHDGLQWSEWPTNPLVHNHWVEDVNVTKHGDLYYMFAEGEHDNHSELLTSKDGIKWDWHGEIEVRAADGKSPANKPCGTPTAWFENGTWYLFYEWLDRGDWLAKSNDPISGVWTNVQDEPVLNTGPGAYDKDMIAIDQVLKYKGAYYAIYHGSGSGEAMPRTWNTDIAKSTDLIHWTKYANNPVVEDNKSSGELVPEGNGFRLYTMHDRVDVFEPNAK
jgi:hypothetical protein